jgi:hypothetical protein
MHTQRSFLGTISILGAPALTLAVAPLASAAGPSAAWTRQFGTGLDDSGRSVATDSVGNLYVAGCIFGTLPGQTSKGGGDAFVRKLKPSGKKIWTRQFGTSDSDSGNGLAIDKIGRVIVVGWTDGTFLGQTATGGSDAFVRKCR